MKIKSGFMLREIAGQWVVVPIGARVVEFNNIMTLAESGAILWKLLEKGTNEEEMASALMSEYKVDRELVTRDIRNFIESIKAKGLCE